jgi:TonB family protein
MTLRTALCCSLLAAGLAVPALARGADAPAPLSPKELLDSMLAADSVQVVRVEVTLTPAPDSGGRPGMATRRVASERSRPAWLRRFAASFVPEGTTPRAELCPTPQPLAGEGKPWMASVVWSSRASRGQAYVDFANGCGFAGLAGRPTVGVDLGAHADSLLALLRQALPRDTVLRNAKLAVPLADEVLPEFGKYVEVSKLPEALHTVVPDYPAAARAAGVSGIVLVQALVGRDGLVKDTKVTMGDPRLVDAAVAAVRRWTFTPGEFAGKPIALWVAVPVTFMPAPDGNH